MTIQDIIKIAYERYPERYEVVQYGEPMDHTGEDMSDYVEDIYETARRGYIEGYADALGISINASHLNQIIWNFKNNEQ